MAAATAAYVVLRHYFPDSAGALDADYAAALSDIPNGVGRVHGVRVGQAAAATLINAHRRRPRRSRAATGLRPVRRG